MIFRPATRADFKAFYATEPPTTMRGIVADRDGIVVGFAGYYTMGTNIFVFTDQRGMTKREIVKGGRAVIEMIEKAGLDAIAKCTGSDSAMRHFGFEPFGEFYRRKT